MPGYEAPVNLAYSQRNRSASCRIPMYSPSPKAKRVEFRCPDPSSNPYLAFLGADGRARWHPEQDSKPAKGWKIKRWSGPCSSASIRCSAPVTSATTARITFVKPVVKKRVAKS